MILGLLAMTFALAYAMMRSQVTTLQINRNAQRNGNARLAALTGLSTGLQKMHRGDWQGINTTLSGPLSSTESYELAYASGDPRLQASDLDYGEYPYRVTLTSTGYASDPGNASVQSTYQARAIVQLVRRTLTAEPSSWAMMQPYTVYHWASERQRECELELPFHIEGPVRTQNQVLLCEDYPGEGSDRPFDGLIDEVAIFNVAMSESTIESIYDQCLNQRLYNAYNSRSPKHWWRLDQATGSTVVADSAADQHGTFQGAVPGSVGAPVQANNLAARFDGFNDNINLGSVDVSGSAMTILAWFKADDFDVPRGRIIAKATGVNEDDTYWMLSTEPISRNRIRLRFRLRSGGNVSSLIASSGNLSANTWVFAAAVYDGSNMYLFKDGEEVGSMSKSGSINTNAAVPALLGDCPPGNPRARLLRELSTAPTQGQTDVRPFTDTLNASTSLTDAETLSLLQQDLQLSVQNVTSSPSPPFTHPGNVATYKLFPGGVTYLIPRLNDNLQNVSVGPNTLTNPLGIFRHTGNLQVGNNVTIQGTIISSSANGGITVSGRNVTWTAVDLPPVVDVSSSYQLPIAIVANDLNFVDHTSAAVNGLVMAWDDVETANRENDFSLQLRGKLIAGELEIKSHVSWDHNSEWWRRRMADFNAQTSKRTGSGSFLQWLTSNHSVPSTPNVSISPDSANPAYHWPTLSQPIFIAHPRDQGLRWEIVDWQEGI